MSIFDKLNNKDKYLVYMYITANQFKNAIKFELANTIPFIVNKSISCEIYLKLIIQSNGGNVDKIHNIRKLYNLSNINDQFVLFLQKNHPNYDISRLDDDLKTISMAFVEWRYVYENKGISLSSWFLKTINNFLDTYCENIVLEKTGIDIRKVYLYKKNEI